MVKRKRKSPIRHNVKSHIRDNKRIPSYIRGKGVRVERTFTSRRRIDKPKSFTINFQYSKKKGDGESVVVIARNYVDALDEAYEEKTDTRIPISVEVIDPDLGRALRVLGREAKAVGEAGLKYGWRTTKALTAEVTHAIANSYREMRVRRLIDECYSPDRVTRIRSRAKLKLRYPEIYSLCDFSKEKVVRYVPVTPTPAYQAVITERMPAPRKPTETSEEYKRRLTNEISWLRRAIAKTPPKQQVPGVSFPMTKEEAREYVKEAKRLQQED